MSLFKRKQKNIMNIIESKNLISRYLIFIFGIFIYSLAYNMFFLKYNLVYGGTGGIGILFQEYIDPSILMLIISFICLIFAVIFFDTQKALNSLVGSILFPIFVDLTSDINIPLESEDLMLAAVYGAVICGIASGIIGRTGLSMGGIDHIISLIRKKFKVSYGTAFAIVNGIIVLFGSYKYGYSIILYALIIIFIMSFITDKVLMGISANKTFFIVTNKEKEVKNFILQNLSRGVTVLDAHGGYSNEKTKVIMVVIPTIEYFKAKEGILEIDPNAFFTISDSYQVYGADAHREHKRIWEEQ